jgi:hypothetical protein
MSARETPSRPWRTPPDLAELQEGLGALLVDLIARGTWGSALRRTLEPVEKGLRYQVGLVAGEHAAVVLDALGTEWPTRDRIEQAGRDVAVALEPSALDRFSDEVLPKAFREALRRLPGSMEATHDIQRTDPHAIVYGVMTRYWQDQPALVARHLALVLPDATWVWRRGIVLALVALREPCGTTVPAALTRAAHAATDPDQRAFLQTQRDTFARASAAIESRRPARERVRKALKRLQMHARRADASEM